ncbi:MAG: methyltransferase domain-containing protein [Limnochordales bacterium]|nr:methyltransferase domain-containing protein [Limnochordales bacterium]
MGEREEIERTVLARYEQIARSCSREPGEESGLGCARLVGLVQLSPGEVLLDIGSGPGLETIELARMVEPAPAFGLDALLSMVEVAEENGRKAGVANVRFLVGRELPFSPNLWKIECSYMETTSSGQTTKMERMALPAVR